MNEQLLRALLELFAIVANITGAKDGGREIVELFLRQHLGEDGARRYLALYAQLLEKHSEGGRGLPPVRYSVKALQVAEMINKELASDQRAVLVVRLLEFVRKGEAESGHVWDFVDTLVASINFPEREFEALRAFVLDSGAGHQLIYRLEETTDGELLVCYLPQAHLYLFKYRGQQPLFLNGAPLVPDTIYALKEGSVLRTGRGRTIYYSDVAAHFLRAGVEHPIVFEARNIVYRFRNRVALHEVSLVEEGGSLLGVMGVSGAGKTTLVHVLCGLLKPHAGTVRFNGVDIHSEKERVRGLIGYVPQEDILIPELTVYENLYYSAKLTLSQASQEELRALVEDTLKKIGLHEVRDLKVGTPLNKVISGGQRKRLNIALELVRRPAVLVVDEPTSGLASSDAEQVMGLLKELAAEGRVVIAVLHQPSSELFRMLDRVLILDEGGYPVFYGNPIECIEYFRREGGYPADVGIECPGCGRVEPEEIFNILEAPLVDEFGRRLPERRIKPEKWWEKFRQRIALPRLDGYPPVLHPVRFPSFVRQCFIYAQRDVKAKLSDLQYLLVTFGVPVGLALVLALLVRWSAGISTAGYRYFYNDNIVAFLFMSVVVALFVGMVTSAEEIFRERRLLLKESFLGLSRNAYLLAKTGVLFVITFLQMCSYGVISGYILGFAWAVPYFVLVLFSVGAFAVVLGLNISSAFRSAVTIYILIPILLIPQILLSGAVVSFNKLAPWATASHRVPLIGDLMASRWALETLMVYFFKNNPYEEHFYREDRLRAEADWRIGYWLPLLREKAQALSSHVEERDTLSSRELRRTLTLLRLELLREQETRPSSNVELDFDVSLLEEGRLSADVVEQLHGYLEKLKDFYNQVYRYALSHRDRKADELARRGISPVTLKEKYHNKHLESVVRNLNATERLQQEDNRIVRMVDIVFAKPAFIDQKHPFDISAPMYISEKTFAGSVYSTVLVNVVVLWVQTFLLWVALSFDLLRRVIER